MDPGQGMKIVVFLIEILLRIDGSGTWPQNRCFLIKIRLKIDGSGTGLQNRCFLIKIL